MLTGPIAAGRLHIGGINGIGDGKTYDLQGFYRQINNKAAKNMTIRKSEIDRT
jgi:hypothetical protein